MTLRITVQEGKVEIEPLPREVKIVQRGPLWVAVPMEEGPPLAEATVEQVLRKVRVAPKAPQVALNRPRVPPNSL